MENQPYLSIVIPAYNEGSRKGPGIKEHLVSITEYFKNKHYSYEIVIVNDGSKDNTARVIEDLKTVNPNIVFINRQENKGKLFSVQEGLMKARGKYRLFTDADGATPIDTLGKFWEHMKAGEHVIIGSRDLAQSKIEKHQPFIKEFLGQHGKLSYSIHAESSRDQGYSVRLQSYIARSRGKDNSADESR